MDEERSTHVMKARMLAATLVVAVGGLTATGAALAVKPATSPAQKNKAAFCKRLDSMVEMKQNAGNRLEKKAARIQARIDSGDLTDEQTARAQKHLARTLVLIAKLDKRVDRLQAAFEKHCTA
jgi:hypothetical protein